MTIAIDIDDTITNSSDTFVQFAKKYNEERKINHKIDIFSLDPMISFGWNEGNTIEFKNKYLEKILSLTTPKDNAVDIINKLKEEGNRIIFITSRSKNELNNMYELTKDWLDYHQIKYDKLIMDSFNKDYDCIENNVDLFIDDSIDNCNKIFGNLKIPVLLFTTRYNVSAETSLNRVNNWNEIYLKVKEILNEKV